MASLEVDQLFFLAVGAALIVSALLVVASQEVVRSLFALVINFTLIGVLFFLLNAEFLAIIQILVYVGAIAVIILFGIMLTKRTMVGDQVDQVEERPGDDVI